jgi:hypothetical protein
MKFITKLIDVLRVLRVHWDSDQMSMNSCRIRLGTVNCGALKWQLKRASELEEIQNEATAAMLVFPEGLE